MNIAMNGFGRIAKNFVRALMMDPIALQHIKLVTINIGPADIENIALLFKYDTIMRQYPGTVEQDGAKLIIDGHIIELIAQLDPLNIDWKKRGIDWVVDCTGKFTRREGAQKHLQAGSKAVLISAPAHGEDVAIVPGVNDEMFDKERHKIVSLASCTTNALMPILKILYDECGLHYAYMETVHAYTNSQVLLDVDSNDPRRSRAAALNIIPTETGASKMVSKIMPALEGKVGASAMRVPVGIVSTLTVTYTSNKSLSVEEINKAFMQASVGSLKGILDVSFEPLVSSDFSGSDYSVVVDGLRTQVVGPLASVSGWYDNEWAYSVRMKDFLLKLSRL